MEVPVVKASVQKEASIGKDKSSSLAVYSWYGEVVLLLEYGINEIIGLLFSFSSKVGYKDWKKMFMDLIK